MTHTEPVQRSRAGGAVDHWCNFWFRPQPTYTLGVIRIAFGALVVVWTLGLLSDVRQIFDDQGVLPRFTLTSFQWSVFQLWPGTTALLIGWVLLLLAAIALTVGWHSRPAAVLVFVLLYSFWRRGTYVYNSGDAIVVIIGLVLALSACGAALSLDQRGRTGSFWSARAMAPWPIRLLQVQVTVIYLSSVQAKLSTGRTWADGSAVFYAWHTDGMWAAVPVPEWLSTNAILVNAVTWTALLTELSIAVLVWNRRCRPWVLAAGVLLHTMIMATLNVGFFSLAIFVLYLAFVPAEVVRSTPATLEARWHERRQRGST